MEKTANQVPLASMEDLHSSNQMDLTISEVINYCLPGTYRIHYRPPSPSDFFDNIVLRTIGNRKIPPQKPIIYLPLERMKELGMKIRKRSSSESEESLAELPKKEHTYESEESLAELPSLIQRRLRQYREPRPTVEELTSSEKRENIRTNRHAVVVDEFGRRSNILPHTPVIAPSMIVIISPDPYPDRWNLVFIIFVLHGIGILMPWNMFITAKSYFVDFKLNVNDSTISTDEYRKNFLPYVGVAAQVPNVICNALNIFVQFSGGSVTFRVIGSILIEIVIFIITVFLAMVDSSTWPDIFFYCTMASVVVLNMANGIYQNSLYGLGAKLPMKYSMAIVLGSNISGTLTSIILIISTAASPNERTAAIYYFVTAIFFLLICVDTYFALPLLNCFRFYERKSELAKAENPQVGRPPYWKIFTKSWVQCFNVFMVFFVTLTIFPEIGANIKRIDENFPISELYFTPVTCFLCFNLFAMIGSLVPNWIKWPGPKYLWIPVVLRLLLIPCFMFCNYKPDKRVLPVLIQNDWYYFVMMIVLAFTSGYYSSLGMMYAPGTVSTEHAPIAGMISSLFLVLGIMCGVYFTFFTSWIVETKLF